MNQVQRLFFILTTIQQNEGVTAPELAKLCNTSVRSIYRDIRRLDDIGIQIMLKGNKGYYLVDKFQAPARLAPEEYLAISLYPILSGQSKLKEHPFQQSFRSAMEKILTRFKVNDELLQLGKRLRIHSKPMNPQQEGMLQKVIEGIIREVTLDCTYYAMYREELTARKMDPYYLVPRAGHLYLIGFCHEREDIRTFRLNRFQSVQLTREKFVLPADFDIDRYLANLWGIQAEADEVTFKVQFSKEVARYIKEERYESNPQLIDQPDGSLLLIVTTRGPAEFLRWMKQYGKHAELLEPESYRQQLLEEIREMEQKYSR
ncbi:helix-turn-helix transcriptional regulator [Effusibacillus pohliae]|uniref:helix-turn-helix transcriptional regulator n=1 Tax=Effusibacillus pohliae TaxID=232270 RepID=UPI00036FF57F|nr:transcriptional regulator [Effusibacillus pohliae]